MALEKILKIVEELLAIIWTLQAKTSRKSSTELNGKNMASFVLLFCSSLSFQRALHHAAREIRTAGLCAL